MKLAYCKSDIVTLKDEVFNMNRFNVTKMMNKLIKGIGMMFIGISIPAIVFKACEESMKYVIDGKIYDFNSIIPQVLNASSDFVLQISQTIIMFTVLISVLKSFKSGDMKQFSKEVFSMVIAYLAIIVFRFIPIIIISVMSAMGCF